MLSKCTTKPLVRLYGKLVCLSEELKEVLEQRRECWVEDWVSRRETVGASATIIQELSEEDRLEFKKILRMSVAQFTAILNVIEPGLQNVIV